jgi:hypothetical protein
LFKVLIKTLKQIVNRAWDLESLDSTGLAKYMRCLFQVALTDLPEVAEGLLDQMCDLAADLSEVSHGARMEFHADPARRNFHIRRASSTGLQLEPLITELICFATTRMKHVKIGRARP